ncbi:MAG TPA: methyltransferase domain-containing protein [Thermoanaerobaculia bacterium]|nr:methyltransferase domain-containing protein [Thermoanaerobaculia bacterium]
MFTPSRLTTAEHLDDAGADGASALRSLRDLRGINRWFGGTFAYRSLVRRITPRRDITLLDIGTGTSDLLASIDAETKIGSDIKLDHLAYGAALDPGARVIRVVASAMSLPFRDGSVDVVTSSHFFHHFSAEENVRILRECLRVARIGVGASDTRRHWVPLLFVRAIAATPLWGTITKHDAPASVQQGYTIGEAAAIARKVGASRWNVVRQIAFRFGVLLWK